MIVQEKKKGDNDDEESEDKAEKEDRGGEEGRDIDGRSSGRRSHSPPEEYKLKIKKK